MSGNGVRLGLNTSVGRCLWHRPTGFSGVVQDRVILLTSSPWSVRRSDGVVVRVGTRRWGGAVCTTPSGSGGVIQGRTTLPASSLWSVLPGRNTAGGVAAGRDYLTCSRVVTAGQSRRQGLTRRLFCWSRKPESNRRHRSDEPDVLPLHHHGTVDGVWMGDRRAESAEEESEGAVPVTLLPLFPMV